MQPKIKARFILDNEGNPQERRPGHYLIEVSVNGAPPDAYAVAYKLDPDTYYNPLREAFNSNTQFAEKLTSYGDYPIEAKIRSTQSKSSRGSNLDLRRTLFEALQETHGQDQNQRIKEALTAIKSR